MPIAPRLETPEAVRVLWELSERLERDARHLGELAVSLRQSARRAAEALVLGEVLDPCDLLRVSGAVSELARQVAEGETAITETLADLPVVLEADPPTELGTRATEALARRLSPGRR